MILVNFEMDLPEDSDTSDDDYVPEDGNVQLPSEEESDGEVEDPLAEAESLGKRGQKRLRKTKKSRKKMKNVLCSPEPVNEDIEQKQPSEEENKKKVDALWADFMKDTGFKSKAERNQENIESPKTDNNVNPKAKDVQTNVKAGQEKVKVVQLFEFAGEEVRVEKEVAANSAEARLLNKPSSSEGGPPKSLGQGRGGLSGIGSVLSRLGKKAKITTLEKSKLDWEKFKKEEDISDELQAYSKSKDGYLERQDFLQRADHRRFEIEKEVRATLRSNRMDNVKM